LQHPKSKKTTRVYNLDQSTTQSSDKERTT